MSQFRLTPAAQRKLSSIWDFTEERWGVSQAEKYIREIQEAVEQLAKDPDRGRVRAEIREEYRSHSVGRHVVFYRERSRYTEVVRILHQRMDFSRHL